MKHNSKKLLLAVFIIAIISIFFISIYKTRKTINPSLSLITTQKNIVPVLVIGSGPAGLSAALYTSRAKLYTIVAAGSLPGGQLSEVNQIENWPGKKRSSGQEAIQDLEDQAEKFGTKLLNDTIISLDLTTWPFKARTENNSELYALSVIIATGRIPKKLDIPGVDTYWGHGVGVCTVCDAPFYKNQIVGVVGGGDTAADRAQQLAAFAKKVYMIVRNPFLDASNTVQEYVKNTKNIHIIYDSEVKKIEGENDKVTGAIIVNNKTGEQSTLDVRGLYFAIGWHPNSELVKNYIATDKEGFILLEGRTQKTAIPGIFAAGDVTDKRYGKAGVATGSGVKAGMDAIDFLQDIGYNQDFEKKIAEQLFNVHNIDHTQQITSLASLEHLNSFIQSNDIVILDFYADYCPNCKTLLKQLAELSQEYNGTLKIGKINIEKAPDIKNAFNITTIPTIKIMINGKLKATEQKISSKNQLKKIIEHYVIPKK